MATAESREGCRILAVDDMPENTEVLRYFLRPLGYEVVAAHSGPEALAAIEATPPDIILLDLMMPGMDGVEVCKRLKSNAATRHIPVVFVTGNADREANLRAVEAGADDFVLKPFDRVLLEARIRTAVKTKLLQDALLDYQQDLEKKVRERTRQVRHTQRITVFALARLAESRDTETGDHLERMRLYARTLAEEMGHREKFRDILTPEYIDELFASTPLHDIGKVGIPDAILLKPGKLTPEEYEIMKTHSKIGGDTLQAADIEAGQDSFLGMGRDIAYHHHEKWDGSGYPQGISGTDIPLVARIAALADVYDALSSKRPYKEAFSHERSREIILDGNGKHFDPEVVDAFLARENEFVEIRARFHSEGRLAPIAVLSAAIGNSARAAS